MNNCLRPNFKKDLNSGDINLTNIDINQDSNSLEDILQNVIQVLKGLPFSTNVYSSEDDNAYPDSINSLIDVTIDKLKEKGLKLDKTSEKEAITFLKGELFHKPLNPTEKNIRAVISGTDLITEEERQEIKLKEIIDEIYGNNNNAFDTTRKNEFSQNIFIKTIIDTHRRKKIDSLYELNSGIIDYQNEQFKIIKEFLISQGFDESLMPKSLYRTNSETGEKVLVKTYVHVLQMMYNYINSLKNKNILESLLEEEWVEHVLGNSKKDLFYRAINAYTNLVYFDDVLKDCLGDYIQIDQNYDNPISVEDTGNGGKEVYYKYTLQKGNSNAVKTWGEIERDSLEEMSKFQQVLIKSIPIYNYETKSIEYGYLEPKDFVGTIAKLIDVGTRLVGRKEFVDTIESFFEQGGLGIFKIFNWIFETENNKTLLSDLEKLGFDMNNVNYLYSIYMTLVKGRNSWRSIENEYYKEHGFTSQYSLVDTLLKVMSSNIVMNYLQSVHNFDTNETITEIKPKYNIDGDRYNLRDNINALNIDRQDRKEILNSFVLNESDSQHYTVTLQSHGTPLNINIFINGNNKLLDKKEKSPVSVNLDEYLKVDISSIPQRQKLISKEGLTNTELEFMSILEFIDKMLATNFSKDIEGLRELYYLQKAHNYNLKELFMSATRALQINKIYDEFEKQMTTGEKKYSRNQLLEFLSERSNSKGQQLYPDQIEKRNDRDKKYYFIKRYDGYQLISVHASQSWLGDLSKVREMLSGNTSKSVISNLDGDKIPNFSPMFLGGIPRQVAKMSRVNNAASAHLLFVQRPNAIIETAINTDVRTRTGQKKQIKNMTASELLYDSIVNKFIIPFLNDKTIYSQSSTYSDKTKFILHHIKLEDIGINNLTDKSFEENIENQIINTIGKAYNEVWKAVVEDYKLIFSDYVDQDGNLNLNLLVNWFRNNDWKTLIAKVQEYNDKHGTNVVFYKDLHYRELKNGLGINELLYEYANNLFVKEKLHERLKHERTEFVNDLLKYRVHFKVSYNEKGELDFTSGNQITKFLCSLDPNTAETWVSGSKLVLAKIHRKNGKVENVLYGQVNLKEGDYIKLNPVLEKYFLVDNLVGNNLRFMLTGSEINHKVKMLKGLDIAKELSTVKDKDDLGQFISKEEYRQKFKQELENNIKFIKFFDPTFDGRVIETIDKKTGELKYTSNITLQDLNNVINNINKVIYVDEDPDPDLINQVLHFEQVYNKLIYKIENAGQNAQFKRNVIIPGTISPYLQGRLYGIRNKMKIAVIKDVQAPVFNFGDKNESIDAHDGSAFINPFASILENWSLQDCEVGTVKKPIHHWFDDRFMSATLLKYAVDTITNQWMRQSEGNRVTEEDSNQNRISLRSMFKKMTNVRWHNEDGTWKFGEIDLIEGCGYNEDGKIDFYENIMEGKNLYYKDGIYDKQIQSLQYNEDHDVYYTIECKVDNAGLAPYNRTIVYHYFQEDGTHIPSTEIIEKTNGIHTIDSLFELHTALGGIYSESLDENNELQFSEASNKAVAKYMNFVAILKPGADPDNLYQTSYYQPLKEAMIDMVANDSAMKNGAGNLNDSSVFYTNEKLKYIEIGTEHYGVQMDADHTADEGHMTEFSQVISSLDAGGRLHDYVSQIYESLGQLAIELSKIELDAVQEFRDTKNISTIYDVVGRTIINNLARNRGQAGLAGAIIDAIKKEFNLNTDHELDEFKIPFSDPNIYSTILSTFVSIINKKSIKRQFPGLGTVMVPGYDISTIYEIDGEPYQFEDILKMACLDDNCKSNLSDLAARNRDLVRQYLRIQQNNTPKFTTPESFQPTDNVLVSYKTDEESENGISQISHEFHMRFTNPNDYYPFKDAFKEGTFVEYLFKQVINQDNIVSFKYDDSGKSVNNKIIIYQDKQGNVFKFEPKQIEFARDVMTPRNLAPAKISWKYSDDLGVEHQMNIFDHHSVRNLFFDSDKSKLNKKAVQELFDNLEKGFFIDEFGKRREIIGKIDNKAAEIIMSNLYKTKFGIKNGESLADIRNEGINHFKSNKVEIINSDQYDLVMTKSDNKHVYITFDSIKDDDESFNSKKRRWNYTVKKRFKYTNDVPEQKRFIFSRVFATTKDNIPLFEVGREIIRKNVRYNKITRQFVDKQTGEVLDNQSKFRRNGENQVLEYVEFLSKNKVTEINQKTNHYDLYNINKENIKRVFSRITYTEEQLTRTSKDGIVIKINPEQKFNEEVNNFISELLANIYQSNDFSGIQVNSHVSDRSHKILSKTIRGLAYKLDYDQDLSEYLYQINEIVNSPKNKKEGQEGTSYRAIKLQRKLDEFTEKLASKRYSSFLKSQNFTVARIPAQTLQSFMQMRNVGFTGVSTNQCFVSHWQTWLQGSDYDIDKAYVMGLSFDGNGRYVGWSNLFKYSSEEAIKVSEGLPMPKRRIYEFSETGLNIDTEIVEILKAVDEKNEIQEIEGYIKLLNKLNKLPITDGISKNITSSSKIYYTIDRGDEVIRKVRNHEFTKIPSNLIEDAHKNFVSSHIQNTVQNLRNMIGAYSPIEMEDFREASNNSPKGEQATKLTLFNPSTKLVMQWQNITGKNVIGIAANGEKASFMWHYYINDVIKQSNISKEKIQKALFSFHSKRILGRASKSMKEVTINTLPDINFEGVDESVKELFSQQLHGPLTVDLMISQVLSAATDNAKELILAKVNAGSKLAKMYLFLITLGYDINDIVSFMTSPVVSFIDDMSNENIFSENENFGMDQIIKLAKGNYNNFYKKLFSEKTITNLGYEDPDEKILKALNSGKIDQIVNPFTEGTRDYINFEDGLNLFREIKSLQNYDINPEVIEDVEEFENVLEGADEFSNLGKLLGFNQGIPTSKIDLQKKVQFIQDILNKRVESVNKQRKKNGQESIKSVLIDVNKFYSDQVYHQEIVNFYDSVKKCANVFDIADSIPQFNSIFQIFSAVLDIDHNLTIKTRTYDKIYAELKTIYEHIPEDYSKRLLKGIDEAIICKFLNESDIKIPYKAGNEEHKRFLVNGLKQRIPIVGDGEIKFNSLEDIASFKILFENVIIPLLKDGKYFNYNKDENGISNIIEVSDDSIKSNKFIQSLIISNEGDVPIYKCDLNMLTIENSQNSKIKFQQYIKGLQQLSKIKIGNQSLADWFVLYNLIINKNQYGADRFTTLFDSFVKENGELSLIRKYLKFVGKLDYKSYNYTLDINVEDLQIKASNIVKSEIGQKDPTIILITESGPKLKVKTKYGYKDWDKKSIIPVIEGEDPNEYLDRLNNYNSYFVLGGVFSQQYQRQIESIKNMDADVLNVLRDLYQNGKIIIKKFCE